MSKITISTHPNALKF